MYSETKARRVYEPVSARGPPTPPRDPTRRFRFPAPGARRRPVARAAAALCAGGASGAVRSASETRAVSASVSLAIARVARAPSPLTAAMDAARTSGEGCDAHAGRCSVANDAHAAPSSASETMSPSFLSEEEVFFSPPRL